MRTGYRTLFAALATTWLVLACTRTPEPVSATPPPRAVDGGEPADPGLRPHVPTAAGYPELTPEAMGRRFLTLIDGLEWIDDLSQARIARVMDMELASSSGGNIHSFTMHLPESGWHYALVYGDDPERRYPFESKYAAYEFSNAAPAADRQPVCVPSMQAYADALKAAQFVAKDPAAVSRSGLPPGYAYYSRRDVRVGIKAQPSSGAPAQPACVERIVVERDLDYCPIAPCSAHVPSS